MLLLPEIPFLQAPKKSHLHHGPSKEQYFLQSYEGLLCLSLSRSEFHRETRKARTSLLFSLFCLLHFPCILPYFFLCFPPIVFRSRVALIITDLMKKIVSFESPYAVCEDQRSKYRHQSLLQDYEELQKEMEVMRRKLQILKQKRLMLSTEVRFCRQRCRYLMINPSSKLQPQQDVSLLQNPKTKASIVSKSRKYSKKESRLQPRVASRAYAKERISNGVEGTSQKSVHVFDLNQNARSFTGKDVFFLNSAGQLFDLNQNDGNHSGKDGTKKSITLFDLNQISVEEEELMGGDIEHMKSEEPKRSARKGTSDKQHGDIKISGCRSMGNGSNRTGKRKISWQDQVALRV